MTYFLRRALVSVAATLALCPQSRATDNKVFYPNVTEGEFEFENRFFDTLDKDPTRGNGHNFVSELGYGATDWWFTEIENEFKKDPQSKWRYASLGLEQVFQLTEPGEQFVDVGFFGEYEIAMGRGESDTLQFGPIVQKQFGRLLATINLFAAADIGGRAPQDPQFSYRVEAKYLLTPLFQPGVQAFGEPGAFSGFDRWSEQNHRIGPVIFGTWNLAPGKINYEAGYLFGLTPGSASGTMKFLLEYEIAL